MVKAIKIIRRCAVMIFATSLAIAALVAGPAKAAGDIVNFKSFPVQTYDVYGDPDVTLTKEQIGDPAALELLGVWKRKRLLVLRLAETQIAVYAGDIIARDPDFISRALDNAPSEQAVSCFGRAGVRVGQPSGAKTRTTKGFGGAFCP